LAIVATCLSPCFFKGIVKSIHPVIPHTSHPSFHDSSKFAFYHAIQKGLRTFKFFPAEQLGGIDTIRMFSGPFSDIRFIPTGGISYKLLPEYLGNRAVAACGGSFMASKEDIENENYRKITDACIRAIDISLGFELAHVGIHHESEEELKCTVSRFASLFRLPLRKSHSAVFAGEAIECVGGLRFDVNRHIGFYTRSANRAIAYFRRMGVPINLASIRKDSNGTITSFYLEEILMGFAIHVIQK